MSFPAGNTHIGFAEQKFTTEGLRNVGGGGAVLYWADDEPVEELSKDIWPPFPEDSTPSQASGLRAHWLSVCLPGCDYLLSFFSFWVSYFMS